MKLFHWKLEGFDILIMAESEYEARRQLMSDFLRAEWQNPVRMSRVLIGLSQPPLFVAEKNYTIAIDNKSR